MKTREYNTTSLALTQFLARCYLDTRFQMYLLAEVEVTMNRPMIWESFLRIASRLSHLTKKSRRDFQYQYRKREEDSLKSLTLKEIMKSLSNLTKRYLRVSTYRILEEASLEASLKTEIPGKFS